MALSLFLCPVSAGFTDICCCELCGGSGGGDGEETTGEKGGFL